MAFDNLDGLEAKLLKFAEQELHHDHQKLKKLQSECREALHLTESMNFKKL